MRTGSRHWLGRLAVNGVFLILSVYAGLAIAVYTPVLELFPWNVFHQPYYVMGLLTLFIALVCALPVFLLLHVLWNLFVLQKFILVVGKKSRTKA